MSLFKGYWSGSILVPQAGVKTQGCSFDYLLSPKRDFYCTYTLRNGLHWKLLHLVDCEVAYLQMDRMWMHPFCLFMYMYCNHIKSKLRAWFGGIRNWTGKRWNKANGYQIPGPYQSLSPLCCYYSCSVFTIVPCWKVSVYVLVFSSHPFVSFMLNITIHSQAKLYLLTLLNSMHLCFRGRFWAFKLHYYCVLFDMQLFWCVYDLFSVPFLSDPLFIHLSLLFSFFYLYLSVLC